jgi:hypothetical protein
MKIAFALMALLTACLMTTGCFAQSSSSSSNSSSNHFQSVGEDYGKTLLGTLKTTNPVPTADNNKSSLWSWGSSPKGTSIIEGSLVGDPKYTMKKLNVVNNWMGDSAVDAFGTTTAYTYTDSVTGEPITTYVDPNTGKSYYTYVDSTSKKTVYVYFNPETGIPYDASFTPPAGASLSSTLGTNYGTNANTYGTTTPTVTGSNDPWAQSL